MKYSVLVIALLLFSFATPRAAYTSGSCKDHLPPVDDLICNTNVTFVLCRLEVSLAVLDSKNRSAAQRCIDQAKESIKPIYQSAKKSAGRNLSAQTAMKDLYSYWLTSIDSLWPDIGMRQYQYEAQLQERQIGIDERGNRLRIEMQ